MGCITFLAYIFNNQHVSLIQNTSLISLKLKHTQNSLIVMSDLQLVYFGHLMELEHAEFATAYPLLINSLCHQQKTV